MGVKKRHLNLSTSFIEGQFLIDSFYALVGFNLNKKGGGILLYIR